MAKETAQNELYISLQGRNNPILYREQAMTEAAAGTHLVKYNEMVKIIDRFEKLLRNQIAEEIKNAASTHA